MRGVKRFGAKGKLSPRFIGPFQILDRVGAVAYRIALPPSLSGVHDAFHVSMLRKYVSDPTHVLRRSQFRYLTERTRSCELKWYPWSKCYGEIASPRRLRGSWSRI